MIVPVDAAHFGTDRLINHPVNVTGLPRSPATPAPGQGQHADQILEQLGFRTDEIEVLRNDGVI